MYCACYYNHTYVASNDTLKIKDLKLQLGVVKNLPNKEVDTVQLYQLNVSSIWQEILFSWHLIT